MKIIERILSELEEKGLKMADLCQFLGIGTSTMATWKTRNTDPPARYIARICEFLKEPPRYILTGEKNNSDELEEYFRDSPLDDEMAIEIFKTIRRVKRARDGLEDISDKKIVPELTEDEQKVLNYYGRLTDEQKDYIKGEMARLNMANKQDTEYADEQIT